jgi:hypothetical protein
MINVKTSLNNAINRQKEPLFKVNTVVHTGAEQALKQLIKPERFGRGSSKREEYVKVQGRLIELVAIHRRSSHCPVELKEMEDIIVLVNHIEEDSVESGC